MTSRAEVTSRYAKAYVKASKKDRGRILDAVVDVTGWSRDNARRRLQHCGARGTEHVVGGLDRPVPEACEGHRPAPRQEHHEAVAFAAFVDQDP